MQILVTIIYYCCIRCKYNIIKLHWNAVAWSHSVAVNWKTQLVGSTNKFLHAVSLPAIASTQWSQVAFQDDNKQFLSMYWTSGMLTSPGLIWKGRWNMFEDLSSGPLNTRCHWREGSRVHRENCELANHSISTYLRFFSAIWQWVWNGIWMTP